MFVRARSRTPQHPDLANIERGSLYLLTQLHVKPLNRPVCISPLGARFRAFICVITRSISANQPTSSSHSINPIVSRSHHEGAGGFLISPVQQSCVSPRVMRCFLRGPLFGPLSDDQGISHARSKCLLKIIFRLRFIFFTT